MPKFPATIGGCVDQLYKLRAERLKVQKKAEELGSNETALRDHILNTFSKDNIEGAKGKLATAGISRRTVANVEDWDQLYKYVLKNKAFDLLQRRVNDSAYRERLEQNEVVPGLKPFQVVTLSLSKASK
jgi:hypothetical protein